MNMSLRNSVLSCMTISPILIQCNSCIENWCLSKPYDPSQTLHSLRVTVMNCFAETSPRAVLIIS